MDPKCFLLILAISLSYGEHPKHSSHIHHERPIEDGEQQERFDHEAILGSKKEEEEFDRLSPEESKRRLRLLAQKMDTNNDGVVSEQELIDWIIVSFNKLDEEEAINQIKQHDEDGDGKVTWREYINRQYGYYPEALNDPKTTIDDDTKKKIKHDEIAFKAADTDHDGTLTLKEYPGFEFPYEYKHMHHVALARSMEDYDKNKDGKVSLVEFKGTEERSDPKEEAEIDKTFHEQDTDYDGFLSTTELKPWILVDSSETSQEEADHLISVADDNKNGKLEIDEIINHHETFVGSQVTNFGHTLEKTEL